MVHSAYLFLLLTTTFHVGQLLENGTTFKNNVLGKFVGHRRVRSATNDETKKWPRKTVYYQFEREFINIDRMLVRDAMKEFHSKTCIRFIESRGDGDYLYLTQEKKCKCKAVVGMLGKMQIIGLADCLDRSGVMHQLMHALGFHHEHVRPDRDLYVKIHWDNIKSESRPFFNKLSWEVLKNLQIPYDYYSVMHPRAWAWTEDSSKPSITPTENNIDLYDLGKAIIKHFLSEKDVIRVNEYYEC